ncbi:AAA ATPase [Thecamonas trahens ATCC 50062]|uniref:AAA ATPase n=1 Tax=Thecamonas trahens ATCC 50062 TaxID=461836 RepID=A0A0L0D9W6_THETB|nr:AAA ATPase [Thecamonas trahens ATCC 50062]KNC48886.1 AAA ATPase [Thecamonas trahens ATCC 50062]|eukprot:XP_013758306.1 AAA ATPase [Thecamonas trahens ATCC 50062]
MDPPSPSPVRLSASSLGAFFYNHCEYFLLRRGTDRAARASSSSPSSATAGSHPTATPTLVPVPDLPDIESLTGATFARGVLFEDGINASIAAAGVGSDAADAVPLEMIADTVMALLAATASASDLAQRLDDRLVPHRELADSVDLRPGHYIYHPRFTGVPFQVPGVTWGSWEPDFLLIRPAPPGAPHDAPLEIVIIDAKSSKRLKLSHQMQVAFYALALAPLLDDVTVPAAALPPWALPHNAGPTIPLSALVPVAHVGAVWRPNAPLDVCKTCEYQADCRSRTLADDTISKIPYLSASAHAALRHTLGGSPASGEFSRIIADSPQLLPPGVAAAYECDKPVVVPGVRSRHVPIAEDLALVVTLAVDPFSSAVFAWSFRLLDHNQEDKSAQLPLAWHLAAPSEVYAAPLAAAEALVTGLTQALDAAAAERPNVLDAPHRSLHVYVWGRDERYALLSAVLRVAASSADPVAAAAAERLALTFVNDANILATSVLPDRIGAALESGISKLRKHEVIERLERFGVPHSPDDSAKDLKAMLKLAVQRGHDSFSTASRLTALEQAVAELVVLPVPGYYTLSDVHSRLVSPSASSIDTSLDAIYDAFRGLADPSPEMRSGARGSAAIRLATKLDSLAAVLDALRALARPVGALVLEAEPLDPVLPLRVNHPTIRRLIFMNQFEMMQTWAELVDDRLAFPGATAVLAGRDGDTPVESTLAEPPSRAHPGKVILVSVVKPPVWAKNSAYEVDSWTGWQLRVHVEAGLEYVDADTLPDFGPWMLVGGDDVMSPIKFPDVRFHRAMWPKGLTLPMAFAGIARVDRAPDGASANLDLLVLTSSKAPRAAKAKSWFTPGTLLVLRERGRDFTTQRVVSHLFALDTPGSDAASTSTFLDLIADPVAWAVSTTTTPVLPGLADAVKARNTAINDLIRIDAIDRHVKLDNSQAAILRSLIGEGPGGRLQLVWGPPGTGKTHALALVILRLIEGVAIAGNMDTPFDVLLTGFTNAAIDNLLARVAKLRRTFAGIANRSGPDWPAAVFVGKIMSPSTTGDAPQASDSGGLPETPLQRAGVPAAPYRELASSDDMSAARFTVLGGTVYQIDKQLANTRPFDLLIVDEGSQLPVAETALAVQRMATGGRLIVAGDHMQLPPIIRQDYPQVPGMPTLFSSILQCLLRTAENKAIPMGGDVGDMVRHLVGQPHVALLKKNYRMNSRLSEFTRALYYADYECMQKNQRLALTADELDADLVARAPQVVTVADSELPMVAVRLVLDDPDGWMGAPRESLVLAEARAIADMCHGLEQAWPIDSETPFSAGGVFVITPHRSQKSMVDAALEGALAGSIDTVEKMQGREVEACVVAYGYFDPHQVAREAEFIYQRARLNVAVTRARNKVVLIYTDAILHPLPQVYESPHARAALEYLRGFVAGAVQIDWPVSLE